MKNTILFILCLAVVAACAPDRRPYHSLIESIGGCDSDGYCGVKLRDGTVLSGVRYPVIATFPDCGEGSECKEILQ